MVGEEVGEVVSYTTPRDVTGNDTALTLPTVHDRGGDRSVGHTLGAYRLRHLLVSIILLTSLIGCASDNRSESSGSISPTTQTTAVPGRETTTSAPARGARSVNLSTKDPACNTDTASPRYFQLAGDIYAFVCRQTVIGYDLVRQVVAWTQPLAWPVRSLSATDAMLVVYTDQSVRASGLTPETRSIVAVGLDAQTGRQIWNRPVVVGSTDEPRPQTSARATVVILPISDSQFAVIDSAGVEKWRLPPSAADIALADNGKLILATPTSVSANTGGRIRDDATNVYDAVSGTLISRVPQVTTRAWSGYGGTRFSSPHDLIDLRSGTVVYRFAPSKGSELLQTLFLERAGGASSSSDLSAIDSDKTVRWNIPKAVVKEFAVIDGHLFVTNTSGQVIEINEGTGTELRQWKTRPTSVGTHWAILDSGPVLSAAPID